VTPRAKEIKAKRVLILSAMRFLGLFLGEDEK
jgi:hypothetical protein